MSLYRALRNIITIESGTTNAAALQALLTGAQAAQYKAELAAILSVRGSFRRMQALGLTMTTLTGSAAAMTLIWASKLLRDNFLTALDNAGPTDGLTAATFIATTSPYRDTLAASYDNMAVALTSAQYRRALWNNDSAMSVVATVTDAMQAMRDSPLARFLTVSLPTANNPVRIPVPSDALLVGWSTNSTGIITISPRRSGSTQGATTANSGTITGTKAEFNNLVPLVWSSTNLWPSVYSSIATRIFYAVALPAGAVS